MVGVEGNDFAVRAAIVRVLPRWGDTAMHMMAIVRALSMPGVRQTAVEVLDKMGPVTGDKETRLLATLAALRGRVADPYQVYGLPTLYGRDRRILDYLIELFRRGHRCERALASYEFIWPRRNRDSPGSRSRSGSSCTQESRCRSRLV